jgi:hypothetical protein
MRQCALLDQHDLIGSGIESNSPKMAGAATNANIHELSATVATYGRVNDATRRYWVRADTYEHPKQDSILSILPVWKGSTK